MSEPDAWQYRDKRLAAHEWRHAPDADFRAAIALHPDIYEVRPLYATPPDVAVDEQSVEAFCVALYVDMWAAWEDGNAKAACRDCVRNALLSVFSGAHAAEPVKVKVKPLEWRPIGPDGSDVEAHTPIGTYIMSFDAPTAGGATNLWMAGADVDTFQDFRLRKEAEAAAQADYEVRIRLREGG